MSDQGYGGSYGDPQYPADPQTGQYGAYGSGYGAGQGPQHGAPAGGSGQRGIFIGLGAVVLAGLIVLVLAISGVFSGSSASTDSPKQVVEKLLFASKKQNLDDVKAVVCERDLRDPELSDIVGDEHATSYSIGAVDEKSDDRVEIDVRVTTSDNDTQSESLPVIKEGGKWKVCFSEIGSGSGSSTTTETTEQPPSSSDSPTPTSTPPTTSGTSGFCGQQDTAAATAKTFISFITLSSTSLAKDCVYDNRLSESDLEGLTGDIYSPTQNDGATGPQFKYRSVNNESTIILTVERQSDGKYYVTAASKA